MNPQTPDNEVARLRDENADLRQQLECAYADREDVRESLGRMLTKSDNEVARLRELLNRSMRIAGKCGTYNHDTMENLDELDQLRAEVAALAPAPEEPKTSTHPDKCIGNVTLDLKRLYQSMPKHLQKKASLHDLKLICDAYNGDQPPVDNQFVADGCEKFGHWPEEPVKQKGSPDKETPLGATLRSEEEKESASKGSN